MSSDRRDIIILGGGGHASVVAEALRFTQGSIVGHIAPEPSFNPEVGTWLGNDDTLSKHLEHECLVAIGLGFVNGQGAKRRTHILNEVPGDRLVTVVHAAAVVSPSALLQDGVFVAAGAIVGTGTTVGAGSIINTGAILDHHCRVGANTHVATGASLAGGVSVGNETLVGAGTVVKQGLTIGDGVVVGAGSVVVSDIPNRATCYGNPARERTT